MTMEAPNNDVSLHPDIDDDFFFLQADSCLLNSRPESILGARNQKQKRCCYAYVVESVLYADLFINKNIKYRVSKDDLIDRLTPLTYDTNQITVPYEQLGNMFHNAFLFVKREGLVPEHLYQRRAAGTENPHLTDTEHTEKIYIEKSFSMYKPARHHRSLDAVKNHLRNQPLAASLDLCPHFFTHRGENVFTHDTTNCSSAYEAKHGITLIGFGKKDFTEYYLFQNSWGTHWGHKGYGKIKVDLVSEVWRAGGTEISSNPVAVYKPSEGYYRLEVP